MDTHIRTLGRLNIGYGVLSALFFLGTVLNFGSLGSVYSAAQADFTIAALFASILFHGAVAVPCIILGLITMRYRQWARSALIVVSALNLMNPPVGTFVGAYSLWALLAPETDPLFSEAPPGRTPRTQAKAAAAGHEKTGHTEVKARPILHSREADAGPQ